MIVLEQHGVAAKTSLVLNPALANSSCPCAACDAVFSVVAPSFLACSLNLVSSADAAAVIAAVVFNTV